jgi:thymidylate synthase ThyX
MAYYCKIIEDSICDIRLTTMELSYPRFILPELNTHRVFSRSTCSHRAIPLTKIIESIKNNPVIPVFWGKNKSGMQADEEINSLDKILAEREWLAARDSAI